MSRRLSVPREHPAFAGHFPGRPVLPGALLLDAVVHAMTEELALDLTEWQLATAKFLAPVSPGAELLLEHGREADGRLAFTVYAGERTALTGWLKRAPPG